MFNCNSAELAREDVEFRKRSEIHANFDPFGGAEKGRPISKFSA